MQGDTALSLVAVPLFSGLNSSRTDPQNSFLEDFPFISCSVPAYVNTYAQLLSTFKVTCDMCPLTDHILKNINFAFVYSDSVFSCSDHCFYFFKKITFIVCVLRLYACMYHGIHVELR